MNFERKSVSVLVCSVLLLALFLALSGCSKEAKMERHWKKGEQYFLENKPREAILEYKNVIQLEPSHSKAHYKIRPDLPADGDDQGGLCRNFQDR